MFPKFKNIIKQFFLTRVFLNAINAHRVYRIIHAKRGEISEATAYDLGIVRESEQKLLRELVEEANALPGPIIEIGTLFGYSTQKIGQWKLHDKEFITVDNYSWNPFSMDKKTHYNLTKKILSQLIKNENVTQVNKDKNEFYETYSGKAPAMVFLDAAHDYTQTKIDIDWAIRSEAKIVCGHDYSDKFPGVKQAVDESGGLERLCGSLWVLSLKQIKR